MEKIFFDNQDELTGRFLVIDEDEKSIWTYLTFPNEERIDKDCYLGSRTKIEIEELDYEKYKRRQIPPPMTIEYSTNESYLPELKEDFFSVDWKENGNAVLKINGKPFLYFVEDEDKGFSKSISKNGIYGNKWNDEKYKEKFK